MKQIFFSLFLLLLSISCEKKYSSNEKQLEITTESKILALLPSEFFQNGYSRSGLIEGSSEIFFTNDFLNVSYVLNNQQILEKGVPSNLKLTKNINGLNILRGEWDNKTAGDGIFIIYLDNRNVVIQIEGLNEATWLYKAEAKVDDLTYNKLLRLFNGNKKNITEKIIFNDSLKNKYKEQITKLHKKFLDKISKGRNVKMNILFEDLNGDKIRDAFIDYCIEPSADDFDTGGGNAMMNMECWESGFSVYINSKNGFELKDNIDKYNLESEGLEYKVDKIENNKIICSNSAFAIEDARCCPSLKHTIFLKFINNKIIKPKQKIKISQIKY
jgi:hypothetical protein